MASRLGKIGMRTMAGALVATGPVIAACETGPSYEQWAETDGAAGRINLDEVQAAFKSSKSGTEFERRVNEIYEGDHLLLIRVEQDAEGTTVEAWENLNGNMVIDENDDDLLFSIQERADKSYNMRGYGANGYYNSGFGAGNFLLTYMVLSSMRPFGGYYYYSQPGRSHYTRLNSQRSSYRRSSGYRSQVSKNTRYFSRQGKFTGSNLSSSRRTYQSTQKSTSGFKSSSTGVRSSWGSSGRGSSFGRAGSRGGFGGGGRGFGGGQVIIGGIGL